MAEVRELTVSGSKGPLLGIRKVHFLHSTAKNVIDPH